MAKALVIVESPAKARTIARYLGEDFEVESSIGHVRDLPSTAAEIPAKYKKEPWSRLGVNPDNNFEAIYVVPNQKKAQIQKLKQALEKADELYLATDEDREGEAIAWHLAQVLKPKVPVRRMVFDEITKEAIEEALHNTRDIDERLVSAQEARRVLDRLYGYEVSPVLWRKVRPRLSAGRVQSVATRLIVDRERARIRFRSAEYWDVEAQLRSSSGSAGGRPFSARLVEVQGRRIATGRDFDELTGELKGSASVQSLSEQRATELASALATGEFRVKEVSEKPFTRRPYAPFITSTLQQEAGRKLRYTAQRTMRVAQSLYETGYITYMRTDSVQLSNEALQAARTQIAQLFGPDALPESPRLYTGKSKSAQEAHEAIRPAGSSFRRPEELRAELSEDQYRLYELIWKRTLASQMKDAQGTTTSVRIEGRSDGESALFAASGRVLRLPGFLRVYVEGSDDPEAEVEDQEKLLPSLAAGDALEPVRLEPQGHTTQPPARYTEASLVKELEERGIGRPSTYASIIQTIQDRGYVWKKGTALVPTFTAFAVTRLLEEHLGELVDFDFTARMEDDLDAIARGDREAQPWLHEFYFGPEDGRRAADSTEAEELGLKDLVGSGWEAIDARQICSLPLGKNSDGEVVAVRVGRYGPYLQIGDSEIRTTIADDIPPEEMTLERASELLQRAVLGEQPLGTDPATQQPVYVKTGRYGDYVQLGDPEFDDKGKVKRGTKPKMAKLWPSMLREGLTLDDALLLLSFPRELGAHPESAQVITVQDGRFGPYLRMGEDTRSLEGHGLLRTITLEDAVERFRQPKSLRRGTSVLRELGQHPTTLLPLLVRTGRYGPYVTDGLVNASLPRGADPAMLSMEQAVELLAAREQKLRDQGKDPRAEKSEKQSPTRKRAKSKAAR